MLPSPVIHNVASLEARNNLSDSYEGKLVFVAYDPLYPGVRPNDPASNPTGRVYRLRLLEECNLVVNSYGKDDTHWVLDNNDNGAVAVGLGTGDWRAVDSLAARDAIPVTNLLESSNSSGQRRRWMRVYVGADDVVQEYELAISDADWAATATDAAKIALLADNSRWRALAQGGSSPVGSGVSLATYSYTPQLRRLVLVAPDTTLRILSVPAGQGRPPAPPVPSANFFDSPFFDKPFWN